MNVEELVADCSLMNVLNGTDGCQWACTQILRVVGDEVRPGEIRSTTVANNPSRVCQGKLLVGVGLLDSELTWSPQSDICESTMEERDLPQNKRGSVH